MTLSDTTPVDIMTFDMTREFTCGFAHVGCWSSLLVASQPKKQVAVFHFGSRHILGRCNLLVSYGGWDVSPFCNHTVDGRNPAPPGMVKTL